MMKHWMIGAALAAAVVVNSQFARAQITSAQRVLVIPFTTLNMPDNQQWIAKGVQENIVADFGRNGGWSPVAFQGQVIVEDNATAARLGRQAAADYAIRGSAQVVGNALRLTAQLIDAKSGDTLSTAAVTGSPNELLRLEDELSSQLRLGPSTASTGGGATTAPAATSEQPAQPQIVVISQPSSPALGYDPGYYNNPYAQDYGYGWGYPGVWWPVVVPIDDGHHHGHGHDDNCPPPVPGHHGSNPVPPPTRHAFPALPQGAVRQATTGFTLPIPQSGGGFTLPIPQSGGGFGLPIPQSGSGFALPIPQTSAPVQRVNTQPIQQQVRPNPTVIAAPRMTAPVMNSAPRMVAPVAMPAARAGASPMQYASFRR